MASGLAWTRRSAGRLAGVDRPIHLPHLEADETGGRFLFLGGPLTPQLFPLALLPLWHGCDGGRTLSSWPAAEQAVLCRWHAAGLLVAAPAPRTGSTADLTVLAPHPDDAQLALGAVIAAVGGRIVDVMTEETWTRHPYYRARPRLAAELLLAEERVACRVLGVEPRLLGHLDGAARPAWRDGFFLPRPAESTSARQEPDLLADVVDDLRGEVIGAGPVLVPLGVGGHVDHVLVREAALELVDEGTLNPARVLFYEDMPYSLFADAAGIAATVVSRAGLGRARPVALATPGTARETKREALWAYRLQVAEGIAIRVLRHGGAADPDAEFVERVWATDASPRGISGRRLPVSGLLAAYAGGADAPENEFDVCRGTG